MGNILPPKTPEPARRSSVTLAQRTWKRVDEIAEVSGYGRDEVLQHFIDWACQEWTAQQKVGKGRKADTQDSRE